MVRSCPILAKTTPQFGDNRIGRGVEGATEGIELSAASLVRLPMGARGSRIGELSAVTGLRGTNVGKRPGHGARDTLWETGSLAVDFRQFRDSRGSRRNLT